MRKDVHKKLEISPGKQKQRVPAPPTHINAQLLARLLFRIHELVCVLLQHLHHDIGCSGVAIAIVSRRL